MSHVVMHGKIISDILDQKGDDPDILYLVKRLDHLSDRFGEIYLLLSDPLWDGSVSLKDKMLKKIEYTMENAGSAEVPRGRQLC